MSNNKGDVILDIRGLVVEANSGQGWRPILDGVDLTLSRGEVVGLIGESGSGKSTLGLAAMGYTRAGCRIAGGSVTFDGLDLVTADEGQRRRIRGTRVTYVAQSAAAAFNPAHRLLDQTIETTLLRGLRKPDDARREAVKLYRDLRLPDPERIGRRFPHQVSGGQLQRIMTAMAATPRPDLIIFDEPTTALDVTTQVEVLASIRQLVAGTHTAALFITHDLAVVAQMADRIKVMRHGRTVEDGETEAMIAAPKEDYTRSLWSVRMLDKAEEPPEEPLLTVRGADVFYASVQALKAVDLTVPRGRTLAVIGESGSGKSTVAKVIAGLLVPKEGRVTMDGTELAPDFRKRNRDQLRRIQMVNQIPDLALNPRQTVWDVLSRPLQFYFGMRGKALEERVHELLALIELDSSYARRRPGTLSGGQKQRICIARALAAKPDLMICDEITSALDQVVQAGILRLLMKLQKEMGMSYLFITHDFAAVRAIADDVAVMLHGRVVESGSKAEVLSPPYDDYTGRLLASVPEIDTGWLDRHLAARTQPPA